MLLPDIFNHVHPADVVTGVIMVLGLVAIWQTIRSAYWKGRAASYVETPGNLARVLNSGDLIRRIADLEDACAEFEDRCTVFEEEFADIRDALNGQTHRETNP